MSRWFSAISALIILSGGSALAHHAYGDFIREKTVTIEGSITDIQFENPHVILKVQADDIYTVVWDSAAQLRRRGGIDQTTLNVGDRITVSGSPARDPAVHRLSLVSDVRRPSDGWHWARGTRPSP